MIKCRKREMSKYPLRQLRKKVGVLFKGQYLTFDSVEISEGGIVIEGDFVLTEGKNLLVNVQIPGGDHIVSIRSNVKTTKKEGALIRHSLDFKDLNISVRREIRSFVSTWKAEEKERKM